MSSTLLWLCLLATLARAEGPHVTGFTPASQSVSIPASSEITVVFDQAIDPLSLSGAISVFGRWSGVTSGSLTLEQDGTTLRFVPVRAFFPGEWVTVSLSKGIKNLNGESMATGFSWNFWIRSAPGSLDLREVDRIPVRQKGEPHIQTYGAYAGDLDGDGYSDLAVPNENSNDVRVFLNDGLGGYDDFQIFPIPGSSRPSPIEGSDFNGDGIIDVAIASVNNDLVSVLLGDGDGLFDTATGYHVGSSPRSLAVIDLDGDGHPDLVSTNRLGDNLVLLRNRGDGTFDIADTLEAGGIGETASAVADVNHDGIMDLFIGTYGEQAGGEMILLLGDGAGGLVYSDKTGAGGRSWMIAAGDVDGDGHVDVVSANSFDNNISVIRSDGAGTLWEAATYPAGAFVLAIDLGDLDGDGDLDIVASNYSSSNWTLYENNGAGQFINPRTLMAMTAGSCAILHDRDGDGDLDMTGIDEEDDLLFLFENDAETAVSGFAETLEEAVLVQNYPNPFNPATTIRYQMKQAGRVAVDVFDTGGRRVARLQQTSQPAGTYSVTWDGRDFKGDFLASGIYIYSITQSGSVVATRKMLLLR